MTSKARKRRWVVSALVWRDDEWVRLRGRMLPDPLALDGASEGSMVASARLEERIREVLGIRPYERVSGLTIRGGDAKG